jgi:hypothetical protein
VQEAGSDSKVPEHTHGLGGARDLSVSRNCMTFITTS